MMETSIKFIFISLTSSEFRQYICRHETPLTRNILLLLLICFFYTRIRIHLTLCLFDRIVLCDNTEIISLSDYCIQYPGFFPTEFRALLRVSSFSERTNSSSYFLSCKHFAEDIRRSNKWWRVPLSFTCFEYRTA